jgi:3',5'-cyclic AMP phosphodiesterase CpdA
MARGRAREAPNHSVLAVAAHHPLYSNGKHRDNPKLIAQWDSLLRRHNVDLYLSGHDHDLQHLEFKGHPTSFVISGGGGRSSSAGRRSPRCEDHGVFAR